MIEFNMIEMRLTEDDAEFLRHLALDECNRSIAEGNIERAQWADGVKRRIEFCLGWDKEGQQ